MSAIVITADPAVTVAQDNPAITAVVPVSAQPYAYNSLSGLPTLGTAAALNAGVSANDAVQLDASGRLPAVDGSQLINLPRGFNCGRLVFSSSTQITFQPCKGNLILINGAVYQIPSGGVTVTNSGLSASTLYYVYAYISSGTLTLELSTTGHSTSATAGNVGTEIKTGDDTSSLVGMVYTNASIQFVYSATQQRLNSWFNRIPQQGFLYSGSSVNWALTGAIAELNSAARITFLSWADQVVSINYVISFFNSASGAVLNFYPYMDAAAISGDASTVNGDGTGRVLAASAAASVTLAEGFHTSSLFGSMSGGTASVYSLTHNVLVSG